MNFERPSVDSVKESGNKESSTPEIPSFLRRLRKNKLARSAVVASALYTGNVPSSHGQENAEIPVSVESLVQENQVQKTYYSEMLRLYVKDKKYDDILNMFASEPQQKEIERVGLTNAVEEAVRSKLETEKPINLANILLDYYDVIEDNALKQKIALRTFDDVLELSNLELLTKINWIELLGVGENLERYVAYMERYYPFALYKIVHDRIGDMKEYYPYRQYQKEWDHIKDHDKFYEAIKKETENSQDEDEYNLESLGHVTPENTLKTNIRLRVEQRIHRLVGRGEVKLSGFLGKKIDRELFSTEGSKEEIRDALAWINSWLTEHLSQSPSDEFGIIIQEAFSYPVSRLEVVLFSDGFQEVVKREISEGMRYKFLISLSQSVLQHLEENKIPLTEEAIIKTTEELFERQKAVQNKELFGKDRSLVIITAKEKDGRFQKSGQNVEEIFRKSGGTNITFIDGSDPSITRQDVLDAIKKSGPHTTIYWAGHGDVENLIFPTGNLSVDDKSSDINFSEFAEVFKGDLSDVIVIFDSCESGTFKENLYKTIGPRNLSLPIFISATSRNQLGYGAVLTEQILFAQNKQHKSGKNLTIGGLLESEGGFVPGSSFMRSDMTLLTGPPEQYSEKWQGIKKTVIRTGTDTRSNR